MATRWEIVCGLVLLMSGRWHFDIFSMYKLFLWIHSFSVVFFDKIFFFLDKRDLLSSITFDIWGIPILPPNTNVAVTDNFNDQSDEYEVSFVKTDKDTVSNDDKREHDTDVDGTNVAAVYIADVSDVTDVQGEVVIDIYANVVDDFHASDVDDIVVVHYDDVAGIVAAVAGFHANDVTGIAGDHVDVDADICVADVNAASIVGESDDNNGNFEKP